MWCIWWLPWRRVGSTNRADSSRAIAMLTTRRFDIVDEQEGLDRLWDNGIRNVACSGAASESGCIALSDICVVSRGLCSL